MKIVWTPTGGGSSTLVDDSVRLFGKLDGWRGAAAVQEAQNYGATYYTPVPQGNVKGQIGFTSRCSYSSRAVALAAWVTAYGFLNGSGSLVLTQDTGTFTMAGAVCKDVVLLEPNGLDVRIQYTFAISTIVSS